MSTQSLNSGSVVQRLARTRELMSQSGIHALLVPSADPHLSEYLPAYWQGRQWLSGFHGSVGTLIVTPTFAGLWADSRYWEQAAKELKGSSIELVKLLPGQPGPLEWLAEQVPKVQRFRLMAQCSRWVRHEHSKANSRSAVRFCGPTLIC